MLLPEWVLGQDNEIKFVLIDSNGDEVEGLGDSFTLLIHSPGAVNFIGGTGARDELGNGFYSYISPAGEVTQGGIVAMVVIAPGTVQQNLAVVCKSPAVGNRSFPYLLTEEGSGDPIEGARIEVSTDANKSNVVWVGYTDAFGYARDTYSKDPYLPLGTVHFWRYKATHQFNNPDTEVVTEN